MTKSRAQFPLLRLVLVVFLFGTSGCCPSFDSDTAKRDKAAHEWLRFWTGTYDWVETSQWRSVSEAKMSQAELLLRDTSSLALTEGQAIDLSGAAFQAAKLHDTPYLLRGINALPVRFPQEVFFRANGDVWVGGEATSQCPVPMQRQAVIAWLDRAPHDVYVTFSVGK